MFKRYYSHIPLIIAAALLLTSRATVSHSEGINADLDVGTTVPPPTPAYAPAPPPAPAYAPPPPTYVAPPPVQAVLPAAPPQFVYVPELGYYVAIGLALDMIYDGRAYYFHNNGWWYRTSYYGEPWQHVSVNLLPALLLRHNIKQMHRFRDVEFKRYKRERGHYRGQLHRPGVRKEERREERRER